MQPSKTKVDARNGITAFSISGGKFESLVLIGILATGAFNIVTYFDIAISGLPLEIPALLGKLTLGEHNPYAYAVGQLMHLGNGIGLSLLFGYVALPISRRIAKVPTVIYGIAFAVVETVIAVWLVMLPAIGAGVAGLNVAPEVPIITLFRHLVFGLVLGVSVRRWKLDANQHSTFMSGM